MGALLDQPGGQPIIRATLDPFSPEGSTSAVNFTTSKASRHWPRPDRSHINWIVTDSDWEAKLAQGRVAKVVEIGRRRNLRVT